MVKRQTMGLLAYILSDDWLPISHIVERDNAQWAAKKTNGL